MKHYLESSWFVRAWFSSSISYDDLFHRIIQTFKEMHNDGLFNEEFFYDVFPHQQGISLALAFRSLHKQALSTPNIRN